MSNKSKTVMRRRQPKHDGIKMSINPNNGQFQYSTSLKQIQHAVKIVLLKDVDFIRVSPVYRFNGNLVCHTNWLRGIPDLPDSLTLIIRDNCIIEAIPETQEGWRMRYAKQKYRGMVCLTSVAYLEIKQAAIVEALGVDRS